MKTRAQMYAREATAILRDITMYRVLTEEQVMRLHPGNSKKAKKMLDYLVKQQRVWPSDDGKYYCAAQDSLVDMDRGLLAAVWILTDFIDRVEFHSVGDYPAKIIFFADNEVYEIVHAVRGKEVLISHILRSADELPSHFLVLVDDQSQIHELQIPNVCGYCTVSEAGEIQYFQKE